MRIVCDNIIFGTQKNGGGISVVWGEFLKRALKDPRLDLSFVEFDPVSNPVRATLSIPEEKRRTVPACLRKAFKYLPVRAAGREPFLFHSSFFRTCLNPHAINVTTVHDFTNELFQTGSGARKERGIKDRGIRHSDFIICISENTKRDFFRFYPDFPAERVRVVFNGVSEAFRPLSDVQGLPFEKGSYLLFVGARGGYKHFDILPEALRRSGLNLVFTGAPLSPGEKAALAGLESRCHHAGWVSDEALNRLYNGALALVYPSAYEGFGLPVVEAQKAGCPVIACNASSIPEVIGPTPLLMDESTPGALLDKLDLLKEEAVRAAVIRDGLENARRFSWDRMYEGILEVYRQALIYGKRR